MIIRELVTKLGFEVNDKAISKYEKGFKSLRNTVLAVSGAVTGAATGLFFIAKSAADTADDLEELSQKSGMNAEALQEFQFSAKQAGVEAEGFSTGLKFLNKNIYEAQKGSEGAADAFNDLFGKGFDSSKFKNNQELLFGIADRFKTMPDGARKTAIAMQIFGRSGSEMIPFLNQGSEAMKQQGDKARALGAIMSSESIKKSAAFSDTLKELSMTISGVKNMLGAELAPVLNEIAQDFESWWMQEENRKDVKEGLVKFAKTMGDLLKDVATRLPAIVDGLSKFIDKMGGLYNVAKTVAGIFAVIWGVKTINDIVNLTQGVYGIAKSIIASRNAMVTFNAATGANPIGLVIAGFVALGSIIYQIATRWEDFKSSMKTTWEFARDLIPDFFKGDRIEVKGGIPKLEYMDVPASKGMGWGFPATGENVSADALSKSSVQSVSTQAVSPVVNNTTTVSGTKIEVKVATDADPQTIAKEIKKSFSEFMANETANASLAVEGSMY